MYISIIMVCIYIYELRLRNMKVESDEVSQLFTSNVWVSWSSSNALGSPVVAVVRRRPEMPAMPAMPMDDFSMIKPLGARIGRGKNT